MSKGVNVLSVFVVGVAVWWMWLGGRDLLFRLASKGLDVLQNEDPDKNYYLKGNFGPVRELVLSNDLKVVQGRVPWEEIEEGVFMRNGPNPQNEETGGYHWFDGDGMIHAVTMKDGKLSYSNTYIETIRYQDEKKHERNLYLRIGTLKGRSSLLRFLLTRLQRVFGVVRGTEITEGTSNTALLFHQAGLYALDEGSLPYQIAVNDEGRVISKGYTSFDNQWNFPFSAHSKVDPETGNLIAYGYQITEEPYCKYGYGVLDKTNNSLKIHSFDITLPRPVMMHDFAITKNYAIIMDLPLVFSREEVVKGNMPFVFNGSIPSRFGVFPHDAKSEDEINWFEAKSCFIFHSCNAWEEGDEVVLVASRFDKVSLNNFEENDKSVYQFRFNMKTGKTEERPLFHLPLDFPRVNPTLLGRKTKYLYASLFQSDNTKVEAVVKMDLEEEKILAKNTFGGRKYGGEAVFVPKKNPTSEDDGFLLQYVFDEETEKSYFWITDAINMNTLATVELPQRVPYGFHGEYITLKKLKSVF